jgi:flagellar biogenesis protein FliO
MANSASSAARRAKVEFNVKPRPSNPTRRVSASAHKAAQLSAAAKPAPKPQPEAPQETSEPSSASAASTPVASTLAVAESSPEQPKFNRVLETLDSAGTADDLDAHRSSLSWLAGLWLVIKLAIVVGLIYLTVFLLKLLMSRKPLTLGRVTQGEIQVLETVALGSNRALHLVAVGEQRLLLASTTNNVHLLCDVEQENASPPVTASPAVSLNGNGASATFSAALRTLQEVADHNGTPLEEPLPSSKKDGRTKLREKIHKMRQHSQ